MKLYIELHHPSDEEVVAELDRYDSVGHMLRVQDASKQITLDYGEAKPAIRTTEEPVSAYEDLLDWADWGGTVEMPPARVKHPMAIANPPLVLNLGDD